MLFSLMNYVDLWGHNLGGGIVFLRFLYFCSSILYHFLYLCFFFDKKLPITKTFQRLFYKT
jgi:hypothetical protein